jgi:hypothetical protein
MPRGRPRKHITEEAQKNARKARNQRYYSKRQAAGSQNIAGNPQVPDNVVATQEELGIIADDLEIPSGNFF